jgi:hypothetical protein
VSWGPPTSSGDAPVTGYTVTAVDGTNAANGGQTCSTTGALTCILTGLTAGDSYTVTVIASNSYGSGVAATSTTPVVPSALLTPTVTIANLPSAAVYSGGSFTAQVSTDSDGAVSVSSSTPAVCSVGSDGLTVSFLKAGTCTLTASVATGTDYQAATGSPESFMVANTVSVTNPGTQSSLSGTAITPLQITASDSAPSATLTYSATGLPPGLSINSATGLISGTPNSAASSPYSVTVTATDNANFDGSIAFTWDVTDTVTVTNPGTQSSVSGTAITPLLIAASDSSPSATLTYSATGLPTGLSISSSGLISGKPTTAGSYSVKVSATDSTGASGSAAFTWTINPSQPPTTLALAALPTGAVKTGSSVAYGVLVSKGSAPGTLTGTVSFTANGVAIASCTKLHVVLGITACLASYPTAGSYSVVATYSGDPDFGSSTATLTQVVDQPPAITSPARATDSVGKSLSFSVTASGSPAPTFMESGTLPKGVTLSSAGLLSGTSAAGTGGTYKVTLAANNGIGAPAAQTFTLVVHNT